MKKKYQESDTIGRVLNNVWSVYCIFRGKRGVIRAKLNFFLICHAVGENCYFGFTILVRLNLILAEYRTCKTGKSY